MRNLILSAFPRKMRLPDPFTKDLRVELLPEVAHQPHLSPPKSQLLPEALTNEIDGYIFSSRGDLKSLVELLQQKVTSSGTADGGYDTQFLNAIVFYIGLRGIDKYKEDGMAPSAIASKTSPVMQLYLALIKKLDAGEFGCDNIA